MLTLHSWLAVHLEMVAMIKAPVLGLLLGMLWPENPRNDWNFKVMCVFQFAIGGISIFFSIGMWFTCFSPDCMFQMRAEFI